MKSLGIFLTQDMRPYSVVESEGFRAMVYKLESRYDIQSWRYFANKVIQNLYEKTRANVELELKKIKNGTFSCSFLKRKMCSQLYLQRN